MGRVKDNQLTPHLPTKKKLSGRAQEPTKSELKESLNDLRSLTNNVKILQQRSVPSEYDISTLTAKLSHLTLKEKAAPRKVPITSTEAEVEQEPDK
ncbi:hypothetical protein INT45_010927 [Circinella minor]|uniref:Uncharacterized protein n=1 Tax=Circinella minor TaxID=1195481 RepID=A0A8H7V4A8_9FUNG|nr:hypothetical protein INT45_010927 [Circinella minor]